MRSLSILFTTLGLIVLFSSQPLPCQDLKEEAASKYCRLNSDEGLWSGPGKNYKVLRRAEAGLLLEIIGEKKEYYRVRVPDGFTCYISADFLEVDADSMGTVSGDRVRLRSIPAIKGDYPIFQVDSGTRLMVWARVDAWYRVTAPEEAYVYVLKDKVTLVDDTAGLQQELAALSARRSENWNGHKASIRENMAAQLKERDVRDRFAELEKAAAAGFSGMDLTEVLQAYKEIAAAAPNEMIRKISESRVREVEAVTARLDLEKELLEREAAWREEQSTLEKALREAKTVTPRPATHDSPGRGRRVTVIGVVDTGGPGIILRGGKSLNNILYRINCPDGRYILGDFNDKRIQVEGRLGIAQSSEEPGMVVVERIEIL